MLYLILILFLLYGIAKYYYTIWSCPIPTAPGLPFVYNIPTMLLHFNDIIPTIEEYTKKYGKTFCFRAPFIERKMVKNLLLILFVY